MNSPLPLATALCMLCLLPFAGMAAGPVYSQKNGEFESMRKLDPKAVREFLERWRAPRT